MSNESPDAKPFCHHWRRYTIRALIVSQLVCLLAVGLYIAGVAMYFADFNFASGGDSRGAVILVAALILSIFGIVGALLTVLCSWNTWRFAGSRWWLVVAILLPSSEIVAILLLVIAM